ncbi:ATP-binding protein [Chlorobium ferrooxidans]|uniref:ATPase n=1 Tax=Chlorobium ferrooxidans DSM 13031 TaxID=377431 RepID=Q0YPR2_9CHLB|nr:hypothetical protein [Chlorobium ferrooxidans]EAT58287.1 conserved hypothetical protein [Chlorobium ferrooxidans DSM 13031]
MSKKLKQGYSNWVDGDRFWGREDDIRLLTQKIDGGANILLVAQRRMGKTSLMKELQRRRQNSYITLFIDLQKATDSEDMIVELSLSLKPYASLWNKTKELFSNVLSQFTGVVEELNLGEIKIKLRAGLTSGNWMEKGDVLFSMLAKSEKPVLLLMDEVPLMVNRMLKGDEFKISHERRAKVDEFMSWLRKNSIEHKGNISIILSGSIGFEPVLRQAQLSAVINNFQPYDLKPWDEVTAVGCLQALANEYGIIFNKRAEFVMIEKLGCCIPHHVQMFFSHVNDRCIRRKEMDFNPEEVDDLYENDMLGIRGHAELTHYEDRLKLILSPEIFPLALAFLTEAAVAGVLTNESVMTLQKEYGFESRMMSEVAGEIMRVLEHDGYVSRGKGGYVFESSLLKDWWKKRYADFYVAVKERR